MKLLIKRDQSKSMMGKMTFAITARAETTDQERADIKQYKLGDTVLYSTGHAEGGSGLLGLASRLAINSMQIKLTVDNLANGKVIECKNIEEMLGIEEQIKEAAAYFKLVLEAASTFGGEEVIEL